MQLLLINKLKTDTYITLETTPSHSATFTPTIDKIEESISNTLSAVYAEWSKSILAIVTQGKELIKL
jgi:hypothetical protein